MKRYLVLLFSVFFMCAQDGSLDTSFGTNGQVLSHSIPGALEFANALAIQADDKIFMVGTTGLDPSSPDIAVIRLLPDGTLDTNFGTNGSVVTPVSNLGNAIALQSDGKIVVCGGVLQGGTVYHIVRYNTDGSLDTQPSMERALLVAHLNPHYLASRLISRGASWQLDWILLVMRSLFAIFLMVRSTPLLAELVLC